MRYDIKPVYEHELGGTDLEDWEPFGATTQQGNPVRLWFKKRIPGKPGPKTTDKGQVQDARRSGQDRVPDTRGGNRGARG